jgi:hypothetical protein
MPVVSSRNILPRMASYLSTDPIRRMALDGNGNRYRCRTDRSVPWIAMGRYMFFQEDYGIHNDITIMPKSIRAKQRVHGLNACGRCGTAVWPTGQNILDEDNGQVVVPLDFDPWRARVCNHLPLVLCMPTSDTYTIEGPTMAVQGRVDNGRCDSWTDKLALSRSGSSQSWFIAFSTAPTPPTCSSANVMSVRLERIPPWNRCDSIRWKVLQGSRGHAQCQR